MIIHYGYTDGSGEYRVAIDTDRCDGCGKCVAACPEGIFEVAPDDYDEEVARVKDELVKKLGYLCPGLSRCAAQQNCHVVCEKEAISHTW